MSHKETPLVKEIVKFAIELLVFQNRLLNGVHSTFIPLFKRCFTLHEKFQKK